MNVSFDQITKVDQWPPAVVKASYNTWSCEDDMQM